MSWLNKISSGGFKPMALPVYPGIGTGYGTTNIDLLMHEETSDHLKRDFPDLSFLDAGTNGIIYNCGEMVCKITQNESEAERAMSVISARHSHIVPVYSVTKIQNNPGLWLIKSKKVKLLSSEENIIYNQLIYDYARLVMGRSEVVDINKVKAWVDRFLDKDVPREVIISMYRSIVDLTSSLKEIGFNDSDLHSGNIGWDGDRLVLFDLEPL
jgi:hypothetical protein